MTKEESISVSFDWKEYMSFLGMFELYNTFGDEGKLFLLTISKNVLLLQ